MADAFLASRRVSSAFGQTDVLYNGLRRNLPKAAFLSGILSTKIADRQADVHEIGGNC